MRTNKGVAHSRPLSTAGPSMMRILLRNSQDLDMAEPWRFSYLLQNHSSAVALIQIVMPARITNQHLFCNSWFSELEFAGCPT
jgi:hypothetical protein